MIKRGLDLFQSFRVELERIVWPTPNKTVRLTLIVIIVTVSVGFFVGGIDIVLSKILEELLKLK